LCPSKRYALHAGEQLVIEAEKLGADHPLRTTILLTPLAEDTNKVRAIVAARNDEAKHLLRTATDYFIAIFNTHDGEIEDVALRSMH
jgi:hypothetical protein